MKFLLIGGQPNTGKSSTISRIFLSLVYKYRVFYNVFPKSTLPPTNPFQDFSAIIEAVDSKEKKIRILVHSATDDSFFINLLNENIIKHQPDIVICSIRDIGWERKSVLQIVNNHFNIEVPLARVTRKGKHYQSIINNNYINSYFWYMKSVDKIIGQIINNSPFNLQ